MGLAPLVAKLWNDTRNYRCNTGRMFSLDRTTPWYEWLSYTECCESLGLMPSYLRFIRYSKYLQSVQTDTVMLDF